MSSVVVSKKDEDIRTYKEDLENVFGDPDKFGLAVLLAFFHQSHVTINYAYSKQKDFGMNLSKKNITDVFDDWVVKNYASRVDEKSYEAKPKLLIALEKDGITMESLTKLANAYIR